MFFLLYEVWCHPRAYDILQNVMVYADVIINTDADEYRSQD